MPQTLLNPDNRLLNWSINDMGLYGAALTPATLSATEQRREYGDLNDARASAPAGETPNFSSGGETALATGPGPVALSSTGIDDGLSAAAPAFQPMALPLPAISAPTLPAGAPADMGAGSTTGIFVPAPVPSPTAPASVSAAPIDATTALSAPTLPAGVAGTAPTLDVPAIVPVLATATAPVADTLDSASGSVVDTAVPAIAESATDALETVQAAATATLDAALAATENTVAATTQAASDAVEAVAATVVTPVVAPVIDALAATDVAGTASSLTDTLAATATGTTSAANDLLTGVGGTDPSGGVATLVDMVAAADEFDLSHVDAAPLADTGSIVDLLAVDLADAPLLGIGDDDHDGTDDDGPHGLFGL